MLAGALSYFNAWTDTLVVCRYLYYILECRFVKTLIRDEEDRTILTLPLVSVRDSDGGSAQSSDLSEKGRNKGRKHDEVKERTETILSIITEDPTATQAAIAERLGITEKQVRTAFKLLKDEYGVIREGGNNNGRWVVKKCRAAVCF